MTPELISGSTLDIDEAELRAFALSVLLREGLDETAAVSIDFVSAGTIAELNEQHMGRTGPTDVLSFPIEDAVPGTAPVRTEHGPPLELGDVVVCADIVERNAAEFGVSLRSELHLMVVHGVLHILGWDHESDAEAKVMEAREAEHLSRVGLKRR